MIKNRINLLRQQMIQKGIDIYFLNTSDYHLSEYVPEYFRTIAYFSGFTGSTASFLLTRDDAYIFVDGRYHVQADKQCLENDIKVIKLGNKDALDPAKFIKKNYPKATVGLDGKRTSVSFVKNLLDSSINIISIDIYSDLIENRPPLSKNPVYTLGEEYVGLSRKRKIELIKHCLKDKVHIVNNLESIAYLLNLRGDDILYTPVFLAYMVIMDDDIYLFSDLERFNEDILDELYADGIIIRPYTSYYDFIKNIHHRKIILDENKVNYQSYLNINCNGNTIYNMRSIIDDMKAIKNPIEQENMRQAHIYDAVSLIRFMMWLENEDKSKYSEYDIQNKIDNFRKEYKAKDLSFSSIVAYNENAAIVHYFPEKDKCKQLDNQGILLFDTGGQYDLGTTDITRTIALGPVDEEIKKYFTLVLKSMFNLSELKFLKGLSGKQIDIIARKDLWDLGVDYRHGTGHGVGFNLAVHEAPPNIRYMESESKAEETMLKPGMIFSIEPGVYFENRFGIRCENLVLCVKDEENEYGQFLKFETLTLVPFDLNLIDKNYLDEKTIRIINDYHQRVYDTLSPYLSEEEKEYLKGLTRKL